MKNYLTFNQLGSECLKVAGMKRSDIAPAQLQLIINDRMMKLYRLIDGINDPFYNTVLTITTAADQEFLKDSANNGGTITQIDATTLTITRSAGTFVAGSIIAATQYIFLTGLIYNAAILRVVSIASAGLVARYEIISGTLITSDANDGLSLNVIKSYSAATVDLSALYLKEIKRISDNGGVGGTVRIFKQIKDAEKFQDFKNDVFNAKEVGFYHRGDTVELASGPSATALTTPVMEYVGKPNIFTDATLNDEILIPPEDNQILKDEVVAEFCGIIDNKVPEDVTARLAHLKSMYEATEAGRAKKESEKNQ
jgi:hypothetical protein